MQFAGNNIVLVEYMGYLQWGVKCLHIYNKKNAKQHYKKYYDLQVELLGFQNLENSIILIEKGNMFIIAMVLLCDVILSNELETFYNEA